MRWGVLSLLLVMLIAGCDGQQSALRRAGWGAARILDLAQWMTIGGAVIWLLVVGLSLFAFYSPRTFSRRATAALVIGGGVVVPTVVLTGLLCYGLSLLPQLTTPAPAGSLRVEVASARWWWRVRYPQEISGQDPAPIAQPVELANQLVLPVGEPVELILTSEDVIHAFWIPSLGGKVDMIPGRQTRLKLEPLQTGNFWGVCAEYCGEAHTHMRFEVQVVSRDEFDDWLVRQAAPAQAADAGPAAATVRGRELFEQLGCGACHAVRGTSAAGQLGPDLTHVASRQYLAAGVLDNDRQGITQWLKSPEHFKPGVEMPPFDWLSDAEMDSLVEFLLALE